MIGLIIEDGKCDIKLAFIKLCGALTLERVQAFEAFEAAALFTARTSQPVPKGRSKKLQERHF